MMNDLIDPFLRKITYLRISVTDRCDLRCIYCMPKNIRFVPRKDLASLEELYRLGCIFSDIGVDKLRITGGEPLVRRNILWLIEKFSTLKQAGKIKKLVMTSNGSQLEKMAPQLKQAGIDSLNLSLDSLQPEKFNLITRGGNLAKILRGIEIARSENIALKINVVALKGVNDDELDDFVRFAGENQCDLTFIEVMPMGELDNGNRLTQYLPLDEVKTHLMKNWDLTPIPYQSGGPARYQQCAQTGRKIGFITPLTQNFCENCNRVRITATGRLYSCLGQENQVDLLQIMRANPDDDALVIVAIRQAIFQKPKEHDFVISANNIHSTPRHMNVTGG